MSLYDIKDESEYRLLEQAREMSSTDDMRQQTALAIAQTRADIICMMEVDNLEALNAFEYGYLFKMVGRAIGRNTLRRAMTRVASTLAS